MASRFVFLIAVCISLISLTRGDNEEAIPSVKILVVGKTGSGKSTLINGLFGSEKAEVGHTLKSKTQNVECFVEVYDPKKKPKFKVTICDSPGFKDSRRNDNVYMNKLESECNDPDLVLYVVSMENKRWTEDEIETIALVNKALGKEVWNNTLLVLTFANEIYNVKRKDEFVSEFVETLWNETGISLTTNDMPVALAGHLSKGEHLPQYEIEYWYTELLIKGMKQAKNNGVDALMLLILYNEDQVRLTEAMKEVFCDIYNHRATKAAFAVGTFTIFVAMLPFTWIPTIVIAAVGTITTALSYVVVEKVTTLDEFCN